MEGEPPILTPWGTIEGYQDTTNGAFAAGWVWDRQRPDEPLHVEIFDGAKRLGTVVADLYRRDVQRAGIGNGCHAFVYPLQRHLSWWRRHHITTCVAGTDIQLRSGETDGLPRPIRRRDRPDFTPIPHYSLSPIALWFYYTFLATVLRLFPRPVWRFPAAMLALLSMIWDPEGGKLDRALLAALALPGTPAARLRWFRCYQRQADRVLLLQGARLTRRWAAEHVRGSDALPPGGAILLCVHHAGKRIGTFALAARHDRLGTITTMPTDARALPNADLTLWRHWEAVRRISPPTYGTNSFSGPQAPRRALRFLREGGYLVVDGDAYSTDGPHYPFLGRALMIPEGTCWLAQRSGKPIIPFMTVPEGRGWRLWIGDPVPPTMAGVVAGLTNCVRRAPGSWERQAAMTWLHAAPWADGEAEDRPA
jgi:hypothetical protein